MATEKRELVTDLLARNKMGAGTAAAARDIKGVGDAAEKASKKASEYGKESEQAARKADDLGDESKQTADRISKLNREIALASAELRVLAKSFADTDDAAERLDIKKVQNKLQGQIRGLSKNKGILETLLPDPEPSVKSFVSKFGSQLESGIGSISQLAGNHVGITIGAAAGAAAGPVLISAISSALAAGTGLAVIGAGVMAAVKGDPQIGEAGKEVMKRFGDGISKSAAILLRPEIEKALGILDVAAGDIAADITGAFAAVAPSIVPFTSSIAAAAENITGAITDIAGDSGPAIEGLGDSIELVSEGVANFLKEVADGGPEAASNLKLVAGATSDLLSWLGLLLNTVNKLSNNTFLTGPLLPLLRQHYDDAATGADKFSSAQAVATDKMTDAEKAAQGEQSALDELANTMRAQADPAFAVLDAQNKLSDAQEAYRKAVKKSGAGSREASDALRDLAKAGIDLEGKVGALGDSFSGELTPQMKATLRAAGLTEDQIAAVGRQFSAAKKKGEGFAKNYKASVAVSGTGTASDRIAHVRDLLAQVRSKKISVSVLVADSQLDKVNNTLNRFGGARASGGPVQKDVPYWVGENGPELFYPDRNGSVKSASTSRQMMMGARGNASGGGGGSPSGIRIELVGQEQIKTMFRYLVRTAELIQDPS